MQAAYYQALAFNDPKRLVEEIRTHSDKNSEKPEGTSDIRALIEAAKANGINVVVEELVE